MKLPRVIRTVAVPACILFGAVGCSQKLVPFTQELREQYQISDEQLQKLQFFVSSDITLQKYGSTTQQGVTPKHTYRVLNNLQIEEVKIDSKTPGVMEMATNNSLTVSFEPGCSLRFGNTQNSGNYWLFGRNWTPYMGEVDYCADKFQAVNGSNDSFLLIDYAVLDDLKKASRDVKGLKLK